MESRAGRDRPSWHLTIALLPKQTTHSLGDHRCQPHRHGVVELAHDLRPGALEQERIRERLDPRVPAGGPWYCTPYVV